MMRLLQLLVFIFLFSFAHGQSDTSFTPTRKGLLKSWRLAGIELSGGDGYSQQGGREIIKHLGGIASTPNAANKLNTDQIYFNHLSNNKINLLYDYTLNFNLSFILKPRIINWERFASFTEISGAITHSLHEWSVEFERFAEVNDTAYFYNSAYSSRSKSILLELGYTVQTPGFFGFLAFYTGPRGYVGMPYSSTTSTDSSEFELRDVFRYDVISRGVLHNPHTDFEKPSFITGFSVPVGMKVSLSPRINISLEYVFSRRTTLFSNGYKYSAWFNGVQLGLRYKLVKDENIPDENKYTPEDDEVPFY